jgi:hypothetical protein
MPLKAAFFVAILVAAATALAPTASADSQTYVLVVQGTDFSVSSFSVSPGELFVQLPLQAGSPTLLHDVASGTQLGTITLEVFEPAPTLVETFSLTNAIAASFTLVTSSPGQVTDSVRFDYTSEITTFPSGPSGSVPEAPALELLGVGILCAAGVWSRR